MSDETDKTVANILESIEKISTGSDRCNELAKLIKQFLKVRCEIGGEKLQYDLTEIELELWRQSVCFPEKIKEEKYARRVLRDVKEYLEKFIDDHEYAITCCEMNTAIDFGHGTGGGQRVIRGTKSFT